MTFQALIRAHAPTQMKNKKSYASFLKKRKKKFQTNQFVSAIDTNINVSTLTIVGEVEGTVKQKKVPTIQYEEGIY